MNDALEMLEYTTILNQIAELTHTEAARRRTLDRTGGALPGGFRPAADGDHRRGSRIAAAETERDPFHRPADEAGHVSDRLPKDAVVPRPHEGNRIGDCCLAVFHRRAAGAGG